MAPWARLVRAVVEQTARVDLETPKQVEIKGTALQIAPSMLLTMRYIFDGGRIAQVGDALESWSARFDEVPVDIGPIAGISEREVLLEREAPRRCPGEDRGGRPGRLGPASSSCPSIRRWSGSASQWWAFPNRLRFAETQTQSLPRSRWS